MVSCEMIIRSVRPREFAAAASVLSQAFAEDRGYQWVFSNRKRRRSQLAFLARSLIRYCVRDNGRVMVADGPMSAVAIWLDIKSPGPIFSWSSMLVSGMFAAPMVFGIEGLLRLRRYGHATEVLQRQHIHQPHVYLAMVGVTPELCGHGLGRALLEEGLKRCDSLKQPCYLETTSESDVRWYERHQFRCVERLDFDANVTIWAMVRDVSPVRPENAPPL